MAKASLRAQNAGGGSNHTRSHGGPISEGLRVRIAYVHRGSGNAILKLEIADGGSPANAGAARESALKRPAIPMAVFLPLWIALSAFSFWLLLISRNAALKRRLFAPLMIGGMILFMAFVAQLGFVPWFAYAWIALIGIANLRSTGFCDGCGRTLHAPNFWSRPGACRHCAGRPASS